MRKREVRAKHIPPWRSIGGASGPYPTLAGTLTPRFGDSMLNPLEKLVCEVRRRVWNSQQSEQTGGHHEIDAGRLVRIAASII